MPKAAANGTVKYSMDVGNNQSDINQAAGLPTMQGLELTVDLTKFTSNEDIALALMHMSNYIIAQNFPG